MATQHRTDPRLGPRGVALLASGCPAAETVAALAASTPDHKWRQFGVIDRQGGTAFFHGALVKPRAGAAQGQGVLALGNILANDAVLPAMVAGFAASPDAPLAERLIAGLAAGEAAGGEHGAILSAAFLVVEREDFPLVDLRVDRHATPLAELRELWAGIRAAERRLSAPGAGPAKHGAVRRWHACHRLGRPARQHRGR